MAARAPGAARGGVRRKTRETRKTRTTRETSLAAKPARRERTHRAPSHTARRTLATTVARATATIAPRSRTILSFS
ncbi:hypothetical protein C6T59_31715 [Burkholderia multivorans]|nr:hypothetical protein C6P74_04675 [Burkholderia multivorans]PRE86119.1 hypothetical protein C6Q02_09355 [Burkholderia multivorans]PRF09810.1 hypothetical protein C6Q01_11950 [Burkholderia multivorans]PRF84780.1 hypothetical protein C6Q23_29125 [Burkholderia multivorans]PRG58391.1 hypothetical protein C6T59_31715 [Burkholderia multivorans]